MKWLIPGAIVSVIVVAAIFLVRGWLIQSNTSALSYALVHDVASFAEVHSHRLPGSWAEFVEWSRSHQGNCRWDVAELEQRFSLAWNQTVAESSKKKLITALRPELNVIEQDLNLALRRQLMGSEFNDGTGAPQ
jgi:hypothetical protein